MKFLFAAILLAYLPLLGILIASTACSLVLDFFGRENRNADSLWLSRELIESGAGDRALLFLGGLLPFPVIALLWQRVLPEPGRLPLSYWFLPFAALLAGCALLSFYASAVGHAKAPPSAPRFRAGAAGLLAVVFGSFVFFLLLSAPFDPEKLPLIRSNPVYLPSWKSITGFLVFLALSFGLAGGIILRFSARPAAGKETPDAGYGEYARAVGTSISVGGALAVPTLVVLNLLCLPSTGLSREVFAAAVVVLFLALGTTLVIFLVPERTPASRGARVPILFALMFLAALEGERAAMANAFLGRPAPQKPPASDISEGHAPSTAEPATEKGKTVFEKSCRPCHLIEKRLVGPPLKDVLSKYRGNPENLKRYLRDPTKVNPAYPLMPQIGLKEEEVDAVARYLLASVGMGGVPEKPAAKLPAEERGKAVFETVCSSCHRFDSRLVGPPFKDVIPKYTGNVEWLKRFIRDPVKTNAGYPAMPKLGLKEEEIDAVARYLLASISLEKPAEKPAEAMPPGGLGQAVFERVCSICHRLDTRLVGPPFRDVVPKYKGDVERLKGFIRNPVKVNPVYPAMPKHALKEEEIDAVARFVLESLEKGKLPEKPAESLPAGERGKAVFDTVCSVCHRFDTRLVGPPLNEVLPKYKGKVEALKGFIRNPVKVNPGYPVMPKHALKEEEIDAVARYLLAKVGKGG